LEPPGSREALAGELGLATGVPPGPLGDCPRSSTSYCTAISLVSRRPPSSASWLSLEPGCPGALLSGPAWDLGGLVVMGMSGRAAAASSSESENLASQPAKGSQGFLRAGV